MPVESKGSLKDIVYAKQYNPFNKGRPDVACWKWIYIMTVMPPSSGERWDLVMLEKTKDLSIIRHKHLHFLISPHCKFRQLPKICEVWIRNLGGMILSGQQCEDWKPTESIERVSLGPEFLAHPWFSLVSIKSFICLVDFNSTTCSPHLPAPRPSPPGPFLIVILCLWNIWGHQTWLLQTHIYSPQISQCSLLSKSHTSICILDSMPLELSTKNPLAF